MSESTNSVKHFLGPRLREGAFIGITAACLYLLLSLVSYTPEDAGWSATGSTDFVSNAGGPAGAWLADVFFSLIGYIAYVFPLMLAARAWILFQHRHDAAGFDWVTFAIRALGLVLVMIAGTALLAMNDLGGSTLPQGIGGILGQAVGTSFTDAFSVMGSRLILFAVLLFGLTVFTDLSWIGLMDNIGYWTLRGASLTVQGITGRWRKLRDRRTQQKVQQERRIAITEHVEREKKRKPPKIKPLAEPVERSERVEKEKQQPLFDVPVTGELPHLDLLDERVKDPNRGYSREALQALSRLLELKLSDFGITAEVVAVYPGPVITRF